MLNNKIEYNISSIVKDVFSKNIKNIRYERKVKLSLYQSDLFDGILESMGMIEEFKQRNISSIYFDDNVYSCAQANLNGDRYRFKTRVRWYNNTLPANLEIKFKDKSIADVLDMSQVIIDETENNNKLNLNILNYL